MKRMSRNRNLLAWLAVALATVAGGQDATDGGAENIAPLSGDRASLPRSPCKEAPKKAELQYESGDLALFSGETEADAAFNAAEQYCRRNSLFGRWRTKEGKEEWWLLLTSNGDWKDADGMDKWGKDRADDIRQCFCVIRARLSKDRCSIWLVCDRDIGGYSIVCRFDLRENALCVLTDGDSADEEPDGTIWVLNKKTYLYDKNGEPDGAAWYEEWITSDGKVVRKGKKMCRITTKQYARRNLNGSGLIRIEKEYSFS